MFRGRHTVGAWVALLAGLASVVAFGLWFFYWSSDWADYVLEFALGAVLVALSVGIWAAIRGRRIARFGGIVGTVLALLVVAYFVFIFWTYGPD